MPLDVCAVCLFSRNSLSCVRLFTIIVVVTWCVLPFYAGDVRIVLCGLATSRIATQLAVSPQCCIDNAGLWAHTCYEGRQTMVEVVDALFADWSRDETVWVVSYV